jgi:hypothetical protein
MEDDRIMVQQSDGYRIPLLVGKVSKSQVQQGLDAMAEDLAPIAGKYHRIITEVRTTDRKGFGYQIIADGQWVESSGSTPKEALLSWYPANAVLRKRGNLI